MPGTTLPHSSSDDGRHDVLSLGEAMIRLSPPGHSRIEFSNVLEVWVGGGEYNLAYALARLGMRAGFISRLVDNPLGRIILNHARAAGLDTTHIVMAPFDGVGRADRVGLNFTEVGTGVRPSSTMYDRGHSAAANITEASFDFPRLFANSRARWFHTGGIFSALSGGCAAACKAALVAAKAHGITTSFDLNFRSKLWSIDQARKVTRELAPHVDVLIGNEGIVAALLGGTLSRRATETEFDMAAFRSTVGEVVSAFPNMRVLGTTVRRIKSGLVNDWWGVLYADGQFYESRHYENLEIEDRIGGGDGFSAGVAYGMLNGMTPQETVELAAALGALLHTTRGDTSQVDLEELNHVISGGSAAIKR